ncbi:hypothetical protein DLAC_06838 [Tieghemostelium lacteum]|uniref:Uncharacterized protein n=1 Tax=Tieghemostelium lacteum TaxID=361077 RepID=A0A151ZDH5_TIELA|nr:hypothetical protein DLAC_06838 [Tieghemostelium lacteum]|eukprot:KYQ92012.1 hypothetical protein DLAC_06838 [Tieghemostelium lacteum]
MKLTLNYIEFIEFTEEFNCKFVPYISQLYVSYKHNLDYFTKFYESKSLVHLVLSNSPLDISNFLDSLSQLDQCPILDTLESLEFNVLSQHDSQQVDFCKVAKAFKESSKIHTIKVQGLIHFSVIENASMLLKFTGLKEILLCNVNNVVYVVQSIFSDHRSPIEKLSIEYNFIPEETEITTILSELVKSNNLTDLNINMAKVSVGELVGFLNEAKSLKSISGSFLMLEQDILLPTIHSKSLEHMNIDMNYNSNNEEFDIHNLWTNSRIVSTTLSKLDNPHQFQFLETIRYSLKNHDLTYICNIIKFNMKSLKNFTILNPRRLKFTNFDPLYESLSHNSHLESFHHNLFVPHKILKRFILSNHKSIKATSLMCLKPYSLAKFSSIIHNNSKITKLEIILIGEVENVTPSLCTILRLNHIEQITFRLDFNHINPIESGMDQLIEVIKENISHLYHLEFITFGELTLTKYCKDNFFNLNKIK